MKTTLTKTDIDLLVNVLTDAVYACNWFVNNSEQFSHSSNESLIYLEDAKRALKIANQFTSTCSETTAEQEPIFQYYYRTAGCTASLPTDENCTCWYVQGTGPHSTSRPSNPLTWRLHYPPEAASHV